MSNEAPPTNTVGPLRVDWGKLLVLLSALGSITLLGALGVVSAETVVPMVTAVIGYVGGNGRVAGRGRGPAPMVYRAELPTEAADLPTSAQLEAVAAMVRHIHSHDQADDQESDGA